MLEVDSVPRQLLDFGDVSALDGGYGSQLDAEDDEVMIGRHEYFLEPCRLCCSVWRQLL